MSDVTEATLADRLHALATSIPCEPTSIYRNASELDDIADEVGRVESRIHQLLEEDARNPGKPSVARYILKGGYYGTD